MKRYAVKYAMMLAVAAVAVSCIVKDDIPGAGSSDRLGKLMVAEIGVSDNVSEKDNPYTQNVRSGRSTDDFNVRVRSLDTGGENIACKWAALPKPLTLPVGNYIIEVESHEGSDAAWEDIRYSASQNFEIKDDETFTIDRIVCDVSNILVSVVFTDKMKDMMGGDCAVEVKIGNCGPLTYGPEEQRRGAFRAETENNTLVWDFGGTLDGKYVGNSSFIRNVRAGEHRTLTFDAKRVPAPGTGGVEFIFLVSVECTTYDVNLNVTVDGETVIEPLDPAIEITSGYSLTDRTEIKLSEMPVGDLDLRIAAEKGISSLSVAIDADNADLTAELASRGITGEFNLVTVTEPLKSTLEGLGLPTGADVSGRTSFKLDLSGLLPLAFTAGSTNRFDIRVQVRDSDNNVETATLLLKLTDDSSQLSIVWRDYDITQKYTFYASEHLEPLDEPDENGLYWRSLVPIKIDITATEGIAQLVVEIISENPFFGKDVLTGIGLDDRFDLVNPDNVDPEALKALGFPTGNDVKDQTFLDFDITNFLPLIFMVSSDEYDEVDFRLTVVDNGGNSETQTIQLKTVKDIEL